MSVDPPSLTPSWGDGDTTWIAFGQWDAPSGGDPSAYPASYINTSTQQTTTDAARQAIGTRQLAAASEDPGAFTIVSDQWTAATLAVRGIVGGGGGGQPARTMHQARMRRAA